MKRVAFWFAAAVLLFTGCTTHDLRFENNATPPPQGTENSLTEQTAQSLIAKESTKIDQLSPDALAALTTAASYRFEATHAATDRTQIARFANALLLARAHVGRVWGYFSSTRSNGVDPGATSAAGTALLNAYRATGEPRYLHGVVVAARAVVSPRFGWRRRRIGAAVVDHAVSRYPLVALTASAFGLLDGLPRQVNAPFRADARAALLAVMGSQVGYARWDAEIGSPPPRRPMSLMEWATTLNALETSSRKRAKVVANAGIQAMFNAAFNAAGQVVPGPLTTNQGAGIASALSTLTNFADPGFARAAFDHILPYVYQGVVHYGSSADPTSQALFAEAFAARELQLKRIA